jgi:hypothetical protein
VETRGILICVGVNRNGVYGMFSYFAVESACC